MPEGSIYYLRNRAYRISYMGGDGNDVTLSLVTPSISNLSSIVDGAFHLRFQGVAALNYVLHGSSNLVNWFPLTNVVPVTNGLFDLDLKDLDATSHPKRFYRLSNP